MSAASVATDLVRALAWPGVVGVAIAAFRKEFRSLIQDRLTRVEAPGGFKAEFERTRVEAEAAAVVTQVSQGLTAGPAPQLPQEIVDQIELNPTGAILAAYEFLTGELRRRVKDAGIDVSHRIAWNANQLAALAASEGIITERSAESVGGLAVMRNLVARDRAGQTGPKQAAEYVTLVSAALYSFRLRGSASRHSNPVK